MAADVCTRSKAPFVSELGQENLGKKRPPDYVLEATEGSDFGFPECPAKPASCSKYTKHFAQFPAHSSPMGLGVLGSTSMSPSSAAPAKAQRSSRCLSREEQVETTPDRVCSTRRRTRRPRREGLCRRPDRHHLQREGITLEGRGEHSLSPSFVTACRPLSAQLLTLYSVSVTTDNASHRRQDGTTSSCAANCDVPLRPHRDHQIMFLSLAHQNPRTRKSGQVPVRSCRPAARAPTDIALNRLNQRL